MHKRHNFKNRAPKIGSSAFFTSKREGHQHFEETLYNPEHTNKYKRPSRAIRRRDKDRESMSFKYSLLAKNYDDLTKFKTFITFLRKKSDIRNMNIPDEQLLTYNIFDITKADVESVRNFNAYHGVFNSLDYIIKHIEAYLSIDIFFTNQRLNVRLQREIRSDTVQTPHSWGSAMSPLKPRAIVTSYSGWIDPHNSVETDLTESTEPFTNNLKTVLEAINKNLKTPKYKTTPY